MNLRTWFLFFHQNIEQEIVESVNPEQGQKTAWNAFVLKNVGIFLRAMAPVLIPPVGLIQQDLMWRHKYTHFYYKKGLPLIFLGKFVIIVELLSLLNYFFTIQMFVTFGIEKSLNLDHFKINFKFKHTIFFVKNGWLLIIESWYSLTNIIKLIKSFSIHKNTILQSNCLVKNQQLVID